MEWTWVGCLLRAALILCLLLRPRLHRTRLSSTPSGRRHSTLMHRIGISRLLSGRLFVRLEPWRKLCRCQGYANFLCKHVVCAVNGSLLQMGYDNTCARYTRTFGCSMSLLSFIWPSCGPSQPFPLVRCVLLWSLSPASTPSVARCLLRLVFLNC